MVNPAIAFKVLKPKFPATVGISGIILYTAPTVLRLIGLKLPQNISKIIEEVGFNLIIIGAILVAVFNLILKLLSERKGGE